MIYTSQRHAAILKQELKDWSCEHTAVTNQYFFKVPIKTYGVKISTVKAIAKGAIRQLNGQSKEATFELCELLFQSGYFEDATIAAELSFSKRKQFQPEDFNIFERWIRTYINNWSSCDKFCNHTVGALLTSHPNCLRYLKSWAKSEHRWLKRAAAVSLIVPARQGQYTDTIFKVADILLNDNDDFVQKGYGWLLKEASKQRQDEVFEFVMKHKQSMSRLSLRYAIEHFPPDLKTLSMVR